MSELTIEKRTEDGIAVLELKGKVTIGAGDAALRDAIKELIKEGEHKILLNLLHVTAMDSSGIGELVSAFTTVNGKGGKLKLTAVPQKIVEILSITQLIQLFEVFDDEGAAMESFGGAAS